MEGAPSAWTARLADGVPELGLPAAFQPASPAVPRRPLPVVPATLIRSSHFHEHQRSAGGSYAFAFGQAWCFYRPESREMGSAVTSLQVANVTILVHYGASVSQ